jgi:hypothetical protein
MRSSLEYGFGDPPSLGGIGLGDLSVREEFDMRDEYWAADSI